MYFLIGGIIFIFLLYLNVTRLNTLSNTFMQDKNVNVQPHLRQDVLFLISTKYSELDRLYSYIETYPKEQALFYINIYHPLSKSKNEIMPKNEINIFYFNYQATVKIGFWGRILTRLIVSRHEYVWIMDDDFLFTKDFLILMLLYQWCEG
eukprot:UN29712